MTNNELLEILNRNIALSLNEIQHIIASLIQDIVDKRNEYTKIETNSILAGCITTKIQLKEDFYEDIGKQSAYEICLALLNRLEVNN